MRNLATVSLLLFAAMASPASASPVAFFGTTDNTNVPGAPGGRCAPALTVSIGPGGTSGTSNFGDFSFTANHCIASPPPANYFDGVFDFMFTDGDQLLGTYTGTLTATSDPTVFDNVQSYVVTGGTGHFADATGTFAGTGTVTRVPGLPAMAEQTFSGTLDGVPEPVTLFVFGAGLFGVAATRKRRKIA